MAATEKDDALKELLEEIDEIEVMENITTEVKNKEWIDILGSGALMKKVLKVGVVDTRPEKGSTVHFDLCGKLEDGTIVDEQTDLVFTVGDGEVIKGLELIAPLMDRDETSEVFIESRFAYGAVGLNGKVPPNTDITYTITLKDFDNEPEPETLTMAERKAIGNRKRERGNWWFNRGEYEHSIQCYKAACDFLDDITPDYEEYCEKISTEETRDVIRDRLMALNNMAAAQIKIEAYDMALKSVQTVLQIDKTNIKALYRKGVILGKIDRAKEGVEVLQLAQKLEPNRQIYNELQSLKEQLKIQAQKEKSLYRRMLGLKDVPVTPLDDHRPKPHPLAKDNPFIMMVKVFFIIVFLLILYNNRIGIAHLIGYQL